MEMRVGDLMTRDVTFVTPDERVRAAAQMMRSHDVGSIPVCESSDNPKLLGIVTDRDLALRVIAEDRKGNVQVKEVMSTDVAACHEGDEVAACAALMASRQVRRILVLDDAGRLVGIVAIGDLAVRPETGQLAAEALTEISRSADEHRLKAIEETAFQFWQSDGCPTGRDIDYWLKAEATWNQQRRSAA
jgi:CBS domain-containing protein